MCTSTTSGTPATPWAAQAGTSTKDLMVRMGHDDMRAAIIYQHASSEADQAIADRLSARVDKHRGKTAKDKKGKRRKKRQQHENDAA